jgi:hypothetical protein
MFAKVALPLQATIDGGKDERGARDRATFEGSGKLNLFYAVTVRK